MKKIFPLLLIVVGFASCKKDNKQSIQELIIGTWKLTGIKGSATVYNSTGTEVLSYNDSSAALTQFYITVQQSIYYGQYLDTSFPEQYYIKELWTFSIDSQSSLIETSAINMSIPPVTDTITPSYSVSNNCLYSQNCITINMNSLYLYQLLNTGINNSGGAWLISNINSTSMILNYEEVDGYNDSSNFTLTFTKQ